MNHTRIITFTVLASLVGLVAVGCGNRSVDETPKAPPIADPPPEQPPLPPQPPQPGTSLEHQCAVSAGYAYYLLDTHVSGGTELHVVGVYESRSGGKGTVTIEVSRPGRHVLVLSSYEPTHWKVSAAAGVIVERVLLNGYHAQSAEVPAGTALESHDHDTNNYHYEIGYKWPSDDTSALIGTAQTLTGLQLTSFRGCYRSTHFTIGEDAPSQPPPPVEPPTTSPSAKLLPGCAHIAKESAYCMALLEGGDVRLAMVGLDSGQLCSGSTAKNLQASGNASLGWIGDKVYACSRDGVVEINIADGATRVANVSCEAVTTHGSEILVMGFGGGIKSYASFDDVLKDKAGKTYNISGVFASRIAARDGQLVFAWHSTNEVQLAPLRDGATVSKLPLAGYDDWVDGLDIVGGKLVVGTPFRVGGIRLFDLATGKHLKTLNVGGTNVFYPGVAGIRCAAGAGS